MIVKIEDIQPSLYFPTAVIVITDCGHRHARPYTMKFTIGDDFDCPYDHENEDDSKESRS